MLRWENLKLFLHFFLTLFFHRDDFRQCEVCLVSGANSTKRALSWFSLHKLNFPPFLRRSTTEKCRQALFLRRQEENGGIFLFFVACGSIKCILAPVLARFTGGGWGGKFFFYSFFRFPCAINSGGKIIIKN